MPGSLFSPRQILAYVAVIAVVLIANPQTPTFIAGSVLAVIGIGFRVWGCGHLRKNKDLITTGPYAHVKHPLYFGTFLISCGGIVAAGAPTMPALLIWVAVGPAFLLAFFIHYLPKKKRIESNRLIKRFGDRFAPYDKAVPDFIPSLKAYSSESTRRWSWWSYRDNNELEMDALIVSLFVFIFFFAGSLGL